MIIVGVTGGTGSGKSTLCRIWAAKGVVVLDADKLYHWLLAESEEINAALFARFPTAYEGRKLNRKALAALVFSNPAALRDLNEITHRFVLTEIDGRLEAEALRDTHLALVDAIHLIGSGLAERCKHTIAVLSPQELRLARIMARDGLTHEQALARIQGQPEEDYFRKNVDFVLENNNGVEPFSAKAEQLYYKIMEETLYEQQA